MLEGTPGCCPQNSLRLMVVALQEKWHSHWENRQYVTNQSIRQECSQEIPRSQDQMPGVVIHRERKECSEEQVHGQDQDQFSIAIALANTQEQSQGGCTLITR